MSVKPVDRRKVVVLSDLHLGHVATRVDEVKFLQPLLEGADEVIFNGDVCEQTVAKWGKRGRTQVEELDALCDNLGVKVQHLTGNHDPDPDGRGWTGLLGGRVFVTHGDMILPDVAPWSHECIDCREQIDMALEAFGEVSSLEALYRRTQLIEDILRPPGEREPGHGPRGRRYLWGALWPPRRALSIMHVWLTMFVKAEGFARSYCPEAEVFLFGHFHRPGIRLEGGRLYCNTGAFMHGTKALIVELEGNWLSVREITRDKDRYFRPGAPWGSFQLGDRGRGGHGG